MVWSWQDDLSKKSRVVCELSIYLKSAKKCFPGVFPLLRDKSSASTGLRMPISILCFGKGPCAAALRLRPFISRLKGEAGRGEEEEQFQRHTLVCQSRPSKTFSYEKKIFHQCIISDSWAWAFNEIFSTADLWWWSMRCIGNHCRKRKTFVSISSACSTYHLRDLMIYLDL